MPIIKDQLQTGKNDFDISVDKTKRPGGKKDLSKDDFMTIFLSQMRMQSPLKPYDSAQMMQQMSALSSMTATEDLQKSIAGLGNNIAKSQIMSASQLIGKKAQIVSSVSPLVKGEGLSGSILLPADVTDATITIKDKNGNVVKTIAKGSSGPGVLDFEWDGKDTEGNELNPDLYKISAEATIKGQKTTLHTAGTFKIESVAMNPGNGSVILNIKDFGGIDMSEIIKIL